jgi:hypothetical protein
MNDSVRLLVVFMVFWALIVMIFNLLGQATAMPEDGGSVDSSMTEESPIRTSDSNAPAPDEAFSHSEQDRSLDKNGGGIRTSLWSI